MIDTSNEPLIPIREIPNHLPGAKPHKATVWRWVLTGVRGVKLETVLVGGRRYTNATAIERFIQATTAIANGEPVPARTSKQRERAIAAAERELAAAGI